LITLLTDFGISDHYVAAMKGVILQICPEANLVDLSHLVPRHSIEDGAYLLAQSTPYFPEGAIHLAVIDPQVGAERRRIAIKGKRSFYVGPDNGLLVPAAQAEGVLKAVSITNKDYMCKEVSSTFEGRDVFAPTAAFLASGLEIEKLGPRIGDLVQPAWSKPERSDDRVQGRIVHIDSFGNIATNIPAALADQWRHRMTVEVKLGAMCKDAIFVQSYADALELGLLVLVGSSGLVEIAVNRGSAQVVLDAKLGDTVTIVWDASQHDRRQQ